MIDRLSTTGSHLAIRLPAIDTKVWASGDRGTDVISLAYIAMGRPLTGPERAARSHGGDANAPPPRYRSPHKMFTGSNSHERDTKAICAGSTHVAMAPGIAQSQDDLPTLIASLSW